MKSLYDFAEERDPVFDSPEYLNDHSIMIFEDGEWKRATKNYI